MPHTEPSETEDHPYPPVARSGDLVPVSGRLGVSEPGVLVPGVLVPSMLVPGGFDAERAPVFAPFATPRPARSCVGVAALPYGGRVEIEALARLRTASGATDVL